MACCCVEEGEEGGAFSDYSQEGQALSRPNGGGYKKIRRFGAHSAKAGRFKGGLHIATSRYTNFRGELEYLNSYLNTRLLPTEPEEVTMRGILINLQNLLEHESEEAIRHYVKRKGTDKDRQFQRRMDNGYISFKAKYDWLRARSLINQDDWSIMDEVRQLRNDYVHTRPTQNRRRFKYKGFQLLSQRSLRRLFVDIELTLRRIGRSSRWMTVPPGYASELKWPEEYIEALEGRKKPRATP
jgi:hypothetical protein